MVADPNNVDQAATKLWPRSVQLPGWMWDEIGTLAERTFSTRSQVLRDLVNESLERRRAQEEAPTP